MKKVICVNTKNYGNPDFPGPSHDEGDILTVSYEGMIDGIYSYQFVESGPDYAYSAWRYATLPDTTADEIESAPKESIVPCPAY